MKVLRFVALLMSSVLLSSCLTTLMTVAALSDEPTQKTTTVVVAPQPAQPTTTVTYVVPTSTTTTVRPSHGQPTTTVIQVNTVTRDLCLYLDLQAVGAAFAQASSVQEFEMILNSSRYMISNLDLNRDGFVDYLRVMEVLTGMNHLFVVQAVLAPNVFQDVATIVLEMGYGTPYCQIIGAPYLYGQHYIVQPVFVRTPPLFDPIRRPGYTPWQSPYYWDHFPPHYAKPAPQHLGHYQAYINTYMAGNRYCHEVSYPSEPHYPQYGNATGQVSRNDYQTSHPEESFSSRTRGMTYTATTTDSPRQVTNAADVRRAAAASTTTTTAAKNNSSSSSSRVAASSQTASSTTASRGSSATTTTSRSGNTSTGSTTTSSSTTSRSGSATSSTTTSRGGSATSATSSATTSRSGSATSATSATGSRSSSATRVASPSTTSRVSRSGEVKTTTSASTTSSSPRASSASTRR